MDKDKKADFEKLAIKRMTKVIKDLRLIANLGNKSNYESTKDQREKIHKVLIAEVDNIKTALNTGSVKSDGFSFDSPTKQKTENLGNLEQVRN